MHPINLFHRGRREDVINNVYTLNRNIRYNSGYIKGKNRRTKDEIGLVADIHGKYVGQ
jgi:hypothetical protein